MSAHDALVSWDEYGDSDALATALSHTVANLLRDAVQARGAASLVVSGGSTPKKFLAALSAQKLDWSRVQVTLADERWVPATSERSNARFVHELLLRNEAASARFVPLFDAQFATPDAAIPSLEKRIAALPQPFDVAMLGMGDDGHFASLFPGGDHLAEGLNATTSRTLVPMRAADAGEPRISFTLPLFLKAHALFLHIEGAKKRATLQRAIDGDDSLPIRTLLQHRRPPLPCFWCP